MDLSVLQYEVVDWVAVIRMSHPPVNALGPAFLEDLEKVLERLGKPGEARAVLITSAIPGVFSAGDDVSQLREIDDSLLELHPRAVATFDAFEALPVPTVAAINGHALGGGFELALTCDFRFMATGSGLVGLPEVRLGMIPAFGGTQRLTQLVGKAKALELMFKGLQLEPEDALKAGLINAVFPTKELYEHSLDYAARLARQATGALASIKSAVNVGLHEGFKRGMEEEARVFRQNIRSHDAKEGVEAFLDGRKPNFKGQ
ncbi:MAG: enoyl-CoA hydratase-related protein [Myxococcales bacterium]|nr:enoyl-CoA hydratase-related protein [Myxococcales bacterium]MDH3483325.1 enoyl-CoA hydratase-related protein [Myxococcales bacterium]